MKALRTFVNSNRQILAMALLLTVGACSKGCRAGSAVGACVVDVIPGADATCLKLGDGSYRCRGENDGGALTHGEWPGLTAPRPWIAIPSQFKSIRLAPGRTCGLSADQTLWCWGRNGLDLESKNLTEPTPVPMKKFGTGIQSFDANRENTCVVRQGQVFCMGLRSDSSRVVQIRGLPPDVLWVGVGIWLGCAATQKDVYCWGRYAWAQPDGSPHAIESIFGDNESAVHIGALPDDFAEGAVGATAGCAMTTSHRVFCWGNAHWGEWGNGVITRCESTPCPEHDFRSLHEVSTISGSAIQLSGGAGSFCVLRADHSVWCWGNNNNELVSTRTAYNAERKLVAPVDEPLPVRQARLGTDVAEVRLGATHACVKKLDASVVCWGNNSYRQIADGTCTDNACAPHELTYDCSAAPPSP